MAPELHASSPPLAAHALLMVAYAPICMHANTHTRG